MAAGGRRPKTVEELKLTGGFRKDRHADRGIPVQPTPLPRAPRPPKWLLAEARAEWLRVGPRLVRDGRLTTLDLGAFALYCQSYARYQQAEAAGEAAKAQQYARLCLNAGRDFGLSPTSRRALPNVPPVAGQRDTMTALLD